MHEHTNRRILRECMSLSNNERITYQAHSDSYNKKGYLVKNLYTL